MTQPGCKGKKKHKDMKEMLKEKIKLEIAEELGLTEKIRESGWGALNAVETGRIGGLLSSRLKSQ